MTLGYPAEVGPPYWTTATVRHGSVASLGQGDPLTLPFLIDCPTFPGNSGGPAFRVPGGFDRMGNFVVGGSADFLGVVIEGRKDYQEVLRLQKKTSSITQPPPTPSNETLLSQQWMNLGVVIPARRVLDLLKAAGVATGVSE